MQLNLLLQTVTLSIILIGDSWFKRAQNDYTQIYVVKA